MANINKIRLSGQTYDIQDPNAQPLLTAGQGITIENNVISATGGGGGKAISGGTNISVTTGETADTINCTLPITASNSSIICGGYGNELLGQSTDSIIAGRNNKLYNYATAAFGHYNICSQEDSSSNFGYSGNTLFSIGNGSGMWSRHNALDIRDNGDIYIADTNDTSTSNYYQKPMIKLQDALGGGGGSSYTAGDGIDITNDVISVTGKVDTSAITTSISSSSTDAQVPSAKAVHDQLGGMKIVKLTESEYTALVTKDSNTLYVVVPDPSN